MADKKNPYDIVFAGGHACGKLKHGLSINGVEHKSFDLREAFVDDLLDAEMEVDVMKPLNFNAQLMIRQLVKIGSFEGPFTVGMIRRLKPIDWRILRAAQTGVDELGEGELASEETS